MKKKMIIKFIVGFIFILLGLVNSCLIAHFFDLSQASFWILSFLNGFIFTIGNRLSGTAMEIHRLLQIQKLVDEINESIKKVSEEIKENEPFPEFNK